MDRKEEVERQVMNQIWAPVWSQVSNRIGAGRVWDQVADQFRNLHDLVPDVANRIYDQAREDTDGSKSS